MTEDDFVDFLAQQGRSSVAALHQFRLSYSGRGAEIHIFLEGDEDALFYLPPIRARLGERELYTYYCGGKWGVVGARNFIQEEANLDVCLFFIDRDLDDFFDKQPDPQAETYITDPYSIENEIVSTEALEITLVDLARMSKADPAYKAFLARWQPEQEEFVLALRPIMAWTLAMRANGKKTNYNNVDLRKVLEKRQGIWRRRKGGFAEFVRATCREEDALPASAARPWLARLSLTGYCKWARGKYVLWFFEAFILSCLSADGAKAKRWAIPSAAREHRLFEVLGARITPPGSLTAFLDSKLS